MASQPSCAPGVLHSCRAMVGQLCHWCEGAMAPPRRHTGTNSDMDTSNKGVRRLMFCTEREKVRKTTSSLMVFGVLPDFFGIYLYLINVGALFSAYLKVSFLWLTCSSHKCKAPPWKHAIASPHLAWNSNISTRQWGRHREALISFCVSPMPRAKTHRTSNFIFLFLHFGVKL